MKNKLYVCGCSFMAGDGLLSPVDGRCTTKLANLLDMEEINYAVRGSSNYGVYLQAKHAIENAAENDIVVISMTSTLRCEWFDESMDNDPYNMSIKNINYNEGHHTSPNYFKHDPEYVGDLRMGQFWQDYDGKELFDYFNKTQKREKMKTIARFYTLFYPQRIKEDNDMSLYNTLHLYATKKNVKHIFMLDTHYWDDFDVQLIDSTNMIEYNWFTLASEYPDVLGTGHCDDRGHDLGVKKLLEKIKDNSWT